MNLLKKLCENFQPTYIKIERKWKMSHTYVKFSHDFTITKNLKEVMK